jgi:hypothetical protein
MSAPENKPAESTDGGVGSNAGLLAAFTPWGRTASPRPSLNPTAKQIKDDMEAKAMPSPLSLTKTLDHTVSYTNRLSKKQYPPDCPPLQAQWYHAVDVPKRKPFSSSTPVDPNKPVEVAKKYVPFSEGDSKAMEIAFQKLVESDSEAERKKVFSTAGESQLSEAGVGGDSSDPNRTLDQDGSKQRVTVPVNEDYLFDVDIERRELAPAYWLGPIYDVRRGSWFFSESAGLRPCDENLATQLENGYLLKEPWKFPTANSRSASQAPRGRAESVKQTDQRSASARPGSRPTTPKESLDITAQPGPVDNKPLAGPEISASPNTTAARTYRLFGAHMNSIVTYEDATTAYVVTDDLYTRMSGTVYERLAGGAHFAGIKVVRGYVDAVKQAEKAKETIAKEAAHKRSKSESQAGKQPDKELAEVDVSEVEKEPVKPKKETVRQVLERQMSTLVGGIDRATEEEEVRKRDEQEIRDDYNDDDGQEQGREIEHLILVTHGIGQRLGLRLESLNFVHDVNTLRKTMKSVYNESADLQALNDEQDKDVKNCRIQVLPICWRHLLDFPRRSLKHNRQEHDLGDADVAEDDEYPTLEDITIQGVPAIRNLITDLGLDILLFQSTVYKPWISRIVLDECNRIYKLFKERNPQFKGKVSFLGHSLGSAVMFDILCHQKVDVPAAFPFFKSKSASKAEANVELDFDVEDFYAIGSPIGLFQMLKGRSIAARHSPNIKPAQTPFGGPAVDPFASYFEIATSAPKCRQIFNIFHPTDPIAYRIEPLISHALAKLQPQPMPYTKRGIFGAPAAQGLTGIGARVGQSVTGLWSSFSTGIANSLLNRSLGLSNEDASRLANPLAPPRVIGHDESQPSMSASDHMLGSAPLSVEDAKRLIAQESGKLEKGEEGENPPTLLNVGLESLYSGFQKQKTSKPEKKDANVKEEDKEETDRMLQREESKIRALNKNGRVDYSIQE